MEEPNRFVAGPKPKTDPCPFSQIKIPSFFSSVNHSSTHPFPYSNPMTTKTTNALEQEREQEAVRLKSLAETKYQNNQKHKITTQMRQTSTTFSTTFTRNLRLSYLS
jgi:hypothetical protein